MRLHLQSSLIGETVAESFACNLSRSVKVHSAEDVASSTPWFQEEDEGGGLMGGREGWQHTLEVRPREGRLLQPDASCIFYKLFHLMTRIIA